MRDLMEGEAYLCPCLVSQAHRNASNIVTGCPTPKVSRQGLPRTMRRASAGTHRHYTVHSREDSEDMPRCLDCPLHRVNLVRTRLCKLLHIYRSWQTLHR